MTDPRFTKSTRLCNSCLSLFENFVLFGRNQNNREKELSRDPAETVMSSDQFVSVFVFIFYEFLELTAQILRKQYDLINCKHFVHT